MYNLQYFQTDWTGKVHMYDFSSNVLHFICLQNHFRITFKANSAVNDISKSMFDVLLS